MTYLTPVEIFAQFAIVQLSAPVTSVVGSEWAALELLLEANTVSAQTIQYLLEGAGSKIAPVTGPIMLPQEWLIAIAAALLEASSSARLAFPPPTGPLLFPIEWTGPTAGSAVVTASLVPLDVSTALADAVDFPPWVGTVTKYAGLCVFLLGLMAWLSGFGYRTRTWGRRVAVSGIAIAIVGFAFGTFVDLLKYVLTP